MANAIHDVSRELRGYHGRWTKGGAALERMSHEAAGEQTAEGTLAKVRTIPEGKGKTVNGHWVDRPVEEGHKYRVKLKTGDKGKRDTKVYETPEEAAHALHTGSHNGAGPGPGPAPSPPKAPASPPGMNFSEITDRLRDIQPGQRIGVNGVGVTHLGNSRYEVQIGRTKMIYGSENSAALAIQDKKHHIGGVKPDILRETARPTGGVAHPKDLIIKAQASADNKKLMRQKILRATTIQAQYTPDMVAKTEYTVTKTPHGKRGRALASSTGSGNTIQIKPDVLVGNNTQAVLEHSVNSGWWPKTDPEHDLATNVLIHENGHGLHGLLMRHGIIESSRHQPYTDNPKEHEFWQGFADAINKEAGGYTNAVTAPKTDEAMVTRPVPGWSDPNMPSVETRFVPRMNVGGWLRRNSAAISQHVSRYGSSNLNEMIAELWTEYALSSNPRAPAKFFGDWATQQLGGKG